MGATAADTQREIEEIRKDVSSAARELRHRVLRATDPKNVTTAVEEHPAALVGVGLGAAGIGGIFAARAIIERRRQRQPRERIRRAALAAAAEISERLEQVRESLPVEVRLGTQAADGERGESAPVERSNPSVVKRVLWAGLVAAMMALGGLVARRASSTIWRSVLREEPPTKSI
ncbi:MAG: hypothetical protein M3O34_10685 [Chloroflexota bacterium]|nr:hypothetical protein [Chloroflexota bacterium]